MEEEGGRKWVEGKRGERKRDKRGRDERRLGGGGRVRERGVGKGGARRERIKRSILLNFLLVKP